MTMLVVTHEMGFARQVANRIVFMDAGPDRRDERAGGVLRPSAARADQAVPQPDPALSAGNAGRPVADPAAAIGQWRSRPAAQSFNSPAGQCASGPLAFFQASMPPSMWQAEASRRPARPAPPWPSARRRRSRTRAACSSTSRSSCSMPPARDVVLQARIGRVQRARDACRAARARCVSRRSMKAMLGQCRPEPSACAARDRPAAARDLLLLPARPSCWPAPPRPSSSGWASFRLFISSTYSSIDFTCRRGL